MKITKLKKQKVKKIKSNFMSQEVEKPKQRLTKGRTVQFKVKKNDPWTVGWIIDMNDNKVCIRYQMENEKKQMKYDEVWIDKNTDKIEAFSRTEHKRNLEDVTGAFEKLNI